MIFSDTRPPARVSHDATPQQVFESDRPHGEAGAPREVHRPERAGLQVDGCRLQCAGLHTIGRGLQLGSDWSLTCVGLQLTTGPELDRSRTSSTA